MNLYIGVDIGKELNYASFLNEKGVEIDKRFKFKNNYLGFLKLKDNIDKLTYDYNLKYDDILVGFESTGHYWINVDWFLTEKLNIKTVMVRNDAVRHTRALNSQGKGKNDSLDSRTIAECLKNGYYFDVQGRKEDYIVLRRLTRERSELEKEIARYKNRFRAWLDVNNPIFLEIFSNVFSSGALALLKVYPSPLDIIKDSYLEVREKLREVGYSRTNKTLKIYYEEVQTYKNIINGISYADRLEISEYIEALEMYIKKKENLDERIEALMNFLEGKVYNSLSEIKGMPKAQVASLIAEIGNINNFKSAIHLLSYAGLNLQGEGSGKNKGHSWISKTGNRKIRKELYVITFNLVRHNDYFRGLYCYYKSYKRPNEKSSKEMLIALMCKLLRVVYGMLKYNVEFNLNEMLKNYDFRNINKEKFIDEFLGNSEKKQKIIPQEIEDIFLNNRKSN
ncbi:IS110 family transposase [Clostridium perfringens]|uniref:Transposase IS116/IS110/IS902 family protein n=7 Tax=Clostridium perfringens TaxID=1502 RepID=A0AAV3FEW7_CLOPF|nr:IS110 family transposase [Clostridium perfringens]EHK2426082.1 IS110 family transposase [Clostridium perfringens]EIA17797.1 transposase IS116/IS110/IS902 family protein [Clostridium perfringens F262]ELC8366835.1 IS110 family transposase [Clostridium perfringens]MBO3344453.1 IS110 family transposase [Clostridium perfringens]MBO3347138.1 IS110 family transposase [Clostridium perfringens]